MGRLLVLLPFLVCGVGAFGAVPAHAAEPETDAGGGQAAAATPPAPPATALVAAEPPRPSSTRRALAAGAAVVPGLVLHGAGHFALGERETAWRLLGWQAVGMASIVAGVGGLAATGASSRTVTLFIPLMSGGVALVATTWLSDLYGVVAPPGGSGEARRVLPRIEAEAGARYVYDRVFPYKAFLVAALDYRAGAFRVAPSAWVAADHDNARLRLAGAYRLWGPRPVTAGAQAVATDATYLEVEAAFTHHRYGSERFALTLAEAGMAGRLDLRRIAPTLAGSFIELGIGWAFGGVTYFGVGTEQTDLLLGRGGWGMFLGRDSARWAEVLLYYDHRHDDLAAGLKLTGLGSGAAGHFGFRTLAYLSRRWGVLVDVQVGAAYIMGASLMMRHGGSGS